MVSALNLISARAVVPDQLIPYVKSIAGLESRACGACVLHTGGAEAVLAAYPANDPLDDRAMNEAVKQALTFPGIQNITVLAAAIPEDAPEDANIKDDFYWSLSLPLAKKSSKLRNMLKRAARDANLCQSCGGEAWTAAHAELVEDFARRKKLDEGSLYLFRRLGEYLAGAPEAVLFSATNSSGKLVGCAIGDYTALATAFYMFAFRSPSAPPGTADLLLSAIVAEAERRGHARVNLGLGIDSGVEFFKKKWQAQKWLPCVETSWPIKKRGWLKKFFGR